MKILQTSGISYHGLGALVIDVKSGSVNVTRTEDLAQPRRAWSTTVLLAVEKVMMVSGSYELNDDVTASYGTEMWDPDTGRLPIILLAMVILRMVILRREKTAGTIALNLV